MRQLYTVGDQVLLSAANFLASIAVMRSAGVEWFGIYSFIVVVATFFHGLFASMIFGQMTLTIATSRARARETFFAATVRQQVGIYLAGAALLGAAAAVPAWRDAFARYAPEIAVAVLYTVLLSMFDLFKRYLYVADEQRRSFLYTSAYFALFLVLLGAVFLFAPAEHVVRLVLASFVAALGASVLTNRFCLDAMRRAKPLPWRDVRRLLGRYGRQGRFSVLGTLVTWVQNQSMTPFLMWASGPTIVGVFNIARLLVTPVQIVNTGVSNGIMPQLRRVFRAEGFSALSARISAIFRFNLAFTLCYFAALGAAAAMGWLQLLIPEFDDVRPYLGIWAAITLATLYRTWITQFFIAAIDFSFLLKASVYGAVATFSGMLLCHFVFDDDYATVAMILVGELVLIERLSRRKRSSCRAEREAAAREGAGAG